MSDGSPPIMFRIDATREFLTAMRYAATEHHNRGDRGLIGARLACQAAARFLAVLGVRPEIVAPFLSLHEALNDVERGITPELFATTDTTIRARSRSSQRKHTQVLAGALMEALVQVGVSSKEAAATVARGVSHWPQLKGDEITPTTIINWRSRLRQADHPDHLRFGLIVADLFDRPDPKAAVQGWLTNGPPGSPK